MNTVDFVQHFLSGDWPEHYDSLIQKGQKKFVQKHIDQTFSSRDYLPVIGKSYLTDEAINDVKETVGRPETEDGQKVLSDVERSLRHTYYPVGGSIDDRARTGWMLITLTEETGLDLKNKHNGSYVIYELGDSAEVGWTKSSTDNFRQPGRYAIFSVDSAGREEVVQLANMTGEDISFEEYSVSRGEIKDGQMRFPRNNENYTDFELRTPSMDIDGMRSKTQVTVREEDDALEDILNALGYQSEPV